MLPRDGYVNDPVESCKIDPAVVASLYVQHADELRNFLTGVLRDPELAGEVAQAAFTKAIEMGHTAAEESLKAWLFRVAFNEALAVRRRQSVHQRATHKLAWTVPKEAPAPDVRLGRWETVQQVQQAIAQLPPDQATVVRMRIYEEKTFAVIAEELSLPLGTVLTRMQSALRKLRKQIELKP